MRRPSTFKKGDLVRLVHAVQAAGRLSVRRVEVRPDGGMIVVVPGGPGEVDNTAEANDGLTPLGESQMNSTSSLRNSTRAMIKIELKGIAKVTAKGRDVLVRVAWWTTASR